MTKTNVRAFADDALDRRSFAEGIYKLLDRLDKGVISIDGDWGVGKTWFGRNLMLHIESKNQSKVIWIDAFEADWIDDPALTLIASIGAVLNENDRKNFFDSVAPIASKAIPAITKIAVQAAGNLIGIDKNITDGVGDIFKTQSEEFVRKKLNEIADRKKTLDHLKESISIHLKKAECEKLIVIVDELDRCSPAYAIRLLERLKHLFEIDGVIFILLWNRQQIKQAVEAYYGAGTNGVMYLDKFVDYPLKLTTTNVGSNSGPMEKLLENFGQKINENEKSQFESNKSWLNAISFLLNLNARQTQRLSTWWVMSNTRNFVALETWLLGLKAKYPAIYEGIRLKDKESHLFAKNLLENVSEDDKNYRVAQLFRRLHESYATNTFDEKDHELTRHCSSLGVPLSESIRVALRHIEETFD